MFEAAELGRTVSKDDFERALVDLRPRLLAAQRALRTKKSAVVVVISGVEGSGKSDVVNRLHEWLDARGMQTHAFWRESDEQRERPRYWRFWRTLPPRGSIGILFGSWYTDPIVDRVYKRISKAELDAELQRINFFEKMLAEDGALLIKLWLHMPKDAVMERLSKKNQRKKKNWMFAPQAKEFSKQYDRFAKVSERAIRMTDTAEAPWRVIEATDSRYRDLCVGQTLLEALEDLVKASDDRPTSAIVLANADEEGVMSAGKTILDQIDYSATIDPEAYDKQLEALQQKIRTLSWQGWNEGRSTVVLFEGSDAAGKGGAIRRLISPMDARIYRVISVAAPTDEERAQHYLWRFWRHIPRAGAVTIYDRSWYGRVLVERVEKFATVDEWSRAYREINDFEEQLAEYGITLVKFWLHIDEEEQLRRFKERQTVPWKQHKITDEDWRNREKAPAYKIAAHDMINRTSSGLAPWTIVPGNDKKSARIQVLHTVARAMERATS